MTTRDRAAYMRDYRASRATGSRPSNVAPIAPPEEAPQAARRSSPTAARRASAKVAPPKVAPAVGGYQPRPGDEWVQRMSSKEQQAILARMSGGR